MKALNVLEISRKDLSEKWKSDRTGQPADLSYLPAKMYATCNHKAEVKDWKKVVCYYPLEIEYKKKERRVIIHTTPEHK